MTLTVERRALQITVALACIVPLVAGSAGVVAGPSMVGAIAQGANPDLESHFRYLSGLLLGIGFAFAAAIPAIERRSQLFLVLSGLVVIGGVARLAAVLAVGPPSVPHQLALVMELIVVPALCTWQLRVARLWKRSFDSQHG